MKLESFSNFSLVTADALKCFLGALDVVTVCLTQFLLSVVAVVATHTNIRNCIDLFYNSWTACDNFIIVHFRTLTLIIAAGL